jgi:hypothetical protein
MVTVATLALGSRPKQKGVAAKRKLGVMPRTPGSARSVREWALTLPRQLPKWELKSQWTRKTSESDFKGQNSSPRRVLYIIKNLLKLKCREWPCIAHLDICNTSYSQKKGRESNWQFDS